MAKRGKDRLGAARLPHPPVEQQRGSRTVHEDAVRTRELGPFLDQPGVEIAEKPDQRGDRRCGCSRPIVAGTVWQPNGMNPGTPPGAGLNSERGGIPEERLC